MSVVDTLHFVITTSNDAEIEFITHILRGGHSDDVVRSDALSDKSGQCLEPS